MNCLYMFSIVVILNFAKSSILFRVINLFDLKAWQTASTNFVVKCGSERNITKIELKIGN